MRTGLRAAQYDLLRSTEGITGDLTMQKATATGYDPQVPITSGWFAQRDKDQASGDQFLAVRVAMTDANLEKLTDAVAGVMSACGIGGLRYKLKSKVAPLGDPAVWLFLCDPTGEPA